MWGSSVWPDQSKLLSSMEYTRNFWEHHEEENLSHTKELGYKKKIILAQNIPYLCIMYAM